MDKYVVATHNTNSGETKVYRPFPDVHDAENYMRKEWESSYNVLLPVYERDLVLNECWCYDRSAQIKWKDGEFISFAVTYLREPADYKY